MSLAGCSILVVEDEAMVALEIELALQDMGAEVVGPASRLEEALATITKASAVIDAAILDVDLHGRDVFPVAEVLQSQGVPFLFHTGHGSREALQQRFGDVPVCTKPTLTEDLLEVVESLLE